MLTLWRHTLTRAIICFIALISSFSCNKDNTYNNNCSNGSSFKVIERVGIPEPREFEVDTIGASRNPVYFISNDSTADVFEWVIGNDPQRYIGKKISIVFDIPVGTITVSLTVKRNSANPCYGKLPDSIKYSRQITIVDADQSPIVGEFYGYNKKTPQNLFSVFILPNGLKNLPAVSTYPYDLRNEIIYGSSSLQILGGNTYDPDNGAFALEGWAWLDKTDKRKIIIDYSYYQPSGNGRVLMKDTFYGIKR